MLTESKLSTDVANTLKYQWTSEETENVPAPEDIGLDKNHSKLLKDAVVLYADLDGSTNMVDNYNWEFSAEIYKIYLRTASQIIKHFGGVITSYDGDRVMAIFTGDSRRTSAVKAALKINWAVKDILKPAIKNQYPNSDFNLKHVIGVAISDLHAVRMGVRGDNDITWVGHAANHAAKLTNLSSHALWITKPVYDRLNEEAKFANGINMWNLYSWTEMNGLQIYYSTYYWNC